MAILVDGGAGYIGSHCVRRLVENGEKVLVVDALYSGSRSRLPESVIFVQADIADKAVMRKLFEAHRIEAVMHLAAFSKVEESVREPLKYYRNNVCATADLLEVMQEFQTPYLIASSSASVYGMQEKGVVDEDSPTCPLSPYGASKVAMEQLIRSVTTKSTILRYFNVAGASEDHGVDRMQEPTNLIPLAIESLLTGKTLQIFGDDYPTPDGTGVRDYIHVLDIAEAHLLALQALRQGKQGNTYNLGYGRGYSVMDIIRGLEKLSGKKLSYEITARRPGDPASMIAVSEKARRELSWKPRHESLQEILESSLAWYERQGW